MANTARMDIEDVLRHFDQLEDPRSSINRRHPLSSVVVIAIMAVVAGANGPTAIAKWAKITTKIGTVPFKIDAVPLSATCSP